jgi:hypothetical protein
MTELQNREKEFDVTEDFDAFWRIQLVRWGFTEPQIAVMLESIADLRVHPTLWVLPRPKISSGLDGWTYAAT